MAFKFESLRVWQKAIKYSGEVHNLTRTFPQEERYILTAQIKRAADSVALNIAEGSTGQSNAEFKKFLSYSIRSGIEVISCLYIGKERDLISESEFQNFYHKMEEIIKMTQGLRNAI